MLVAQDCRRDEANPKSLSRSWILRKRRSSPIAVEMGNRLQSFATRHCKPLAQSFANDWFGARMRDQAAGAGGEDLKAHGISSSMRDCGWPSAIASRVAFIQA